MNPRRYFHIGKGELYAFGASSLWSLFPIMTALSFSSIGPLWSAALSTGAAALYFSVTMTMQRQWNQLAVRKAWRPILLHTAIIGIAMYTLMFLGIQRTSAGNAAILSQTEVFFAFIILTLLMKHEAITRKQMSGAVCIFAGACLVLLPDVSSWQWGGLLIVAAKMLAPFGNRYSQMARKMVSAQTIMFIRSVISCLFLCAIAIMIEGNLNGEQLRASVPFILINGCLLMGFSKVLWINGMHYIPITKGNAIASLNPVLTMILAYPILGETARPIQLLGLPAVIVGVLLLTAKSKT